ncbi:MAG: outer membrane family protein [Helicobacter trogontum]|uniref:outer membrane family protein n=1 Tax=Helicobacter trogontum TaxID=50960 RepID=UPI002430D1BD|nr:outer membrane family protein [Helicobacter trogontum]MCI5787563.1 outer membrane family protein [Helicobacter trogontum]
MQLHRILICSAFCFSALYARQNEITIMDQEYKDTEPVIKQDNGVFLHGGLEIFNKTAFSTKQALPNNSYGYALGQLSVGYKYNDFQIMVGAVAAGLTYDSTKGLAYNYVGAYPGYLNDREANADNTRNIFVHNAYIHYQTDSINVKAGRFEQEDDDWFDSYAEGINAIFRFADHFHVKIFGSSTVALVGNGWLTDFSTLYSTYGIVNAEVGYNNEFLDTKAYVYYGAKEYVAPGFSISAEFGNKESISYTTKLSALFPIHSQSIIDLDNYFFSSFKDPTGFTSSILVRQDIDFYDTYKLALGIYKNIGNANARMGMFGNPIGIDIWDNSVYSTGASLNASVAPDALSVLLFTEARYENLAKYVQSLSFGLNGRYTTAPSAIEYSLKFIVDWQIIDTVNLDLIANYYTHVMQSDAWNESDIALTGRNILDRSYLMSSITYAF